MSQKFPWEEIQRDIRAAPTPNPDRREALLACAEVRSLLEYRWRDWERRKTEVFEKSADFISQSGENADTAKGILENSIGGPFSPVLLAQQLCMVGELADVDGVKRMRSIVENERKKYAANLTKLKEVRADITDSAEFAYLMDFAAYELEKLGARMLSLWPPREAFPHGAGRPGVAAVAFRWIASFVPSEYARPDTEPHQKIIEAIAGALGIAFESSTYAVISGSGWSWRATDGRSENSG